MAKNKNPYQINVFLEKEDFEKAVKISNIEDRSLSNFGRVAIKYFISYIEQQYASQGKAIDWRQK